jgi:putative nucleotidyltransferase with HDIG domain
VKILQGVEDVVRESCLNSSFYSATSWTHSKNVAEISRKLALKNRGDQLVAQTAGLLHDIGSVRYGREDHHWTGARDAVVILKSFGFTPVFIAKVAHCIYTHRSSVRIKCKSAEALWVMAADAMDHFIRADEMIAVTKRDLSLSEPEARTYLLEKFARDWEKIPEEIKPLVLRDYRQALAAIQKPRLF